MQNLMVIAPTCALYRRSQKASSWGSDANISAGEAMVVASFPLCVNYKAIILLRLSSTLIWLDRASLVMLYRVLPNDIFIRLKIT